MTTLTFLKMSMSEHLSLLPPRARQKVTRLGAATSAAGRVQEIQHAVISPVTTLTLKANAITFQFATSTLSALTHSG